MQTFRLERCQPKLNAEQMPLNAIVFIKCGISNSKMNWDVTFRVSFYEAIILECRYFLLSFSKHVVDMKYLWKVDTFCGFIIHQKLF